MEGLELKSILLDLLMNIINIFLLYVIVRGLVYKPVKNYLENRKAKIAAEHEAADRLHTEAEQLKTNYESKLAEGEATAKAIIRKSEGDARVKANEIVESAKNDAKKLIDNAEKDIASKKHDMIEAIKGDVVDLSLSIASKVIGKNLSDEDNRRIAEEFFKNESQNIR